MAEDRRIDRPLFIITGQTATGKTDFSIRLAMRIGGEIICCDSMQVYRGFDAITFPPTQEERRKVKHYLFCFVDPSQNYDVNHHRLLVKDLVSDIWSRNKIPILVGGTGFYIQVILEGIFNFSSSEEVRKNLWKRVKDNNLFEELRNVDPIYASKIHPNDLRRVIRALEVYYVTGKPISWWHKKREGGLLSEIDKLYMWIFFSDRDTLKRRIALRLAKLTLDDAFAIYNIVKKGISKTSSQMLGLKELISVAEGEIDLDEAKKLLVKKTYQYARRQMIWMRRYARQLSEKAGGRLRLRWVKV